MAGLGRAFRLGAVPIGQLRQHHHHHPRLSSFRPRQPSLRWSVQRRESCVSASSQLLSSISRTQWPPLRPQLSPARAAAAGVHPASRRWETSSTGDDKSGHIAATPGEGILFIDNVYPLRIGSLLGWRIWRPTADYDDAAIASLLKRFKASSSPASGSGSDSAPAPAPATSSPFSPTAIFTALTSVVDPISLVQRALPTDPGFAVTEIIPRIKDGGVFVKLRHPADTSLDAVEARLNKLLEAHPVRPWFNPLWGCVRAGLVRGVPWLEDLASRVPSGRIRVEFYAASSRAAGDGATGGANLELSQETLYSLFRRYGKIAEITTAPVDAKAAPSSRAATIDFIRVRDAVMARSCLHGYVVDGTTRLRLSHPRIVIPILAALLATVTVAVFDPIRAFFIRAHVQRSFALRDSRLYQWFLRRTSAFMAFARTSYDAAADGMGLGNGRDGAGGGRSARGQDALMSHRRDLLDSLRTWLLETTETFIVVQGSRGSGKNELVLDQALRGRRNVLVIDCKPIVEARGESATIKRMATAVGYRPVFSWANSLSSLVDLAVQGTTGVKSGFSETLDEQLAKILQTAATALRDVGLAGRDKTDDDAHLTADAYLEAHPERRPVVVLDNFGQRNEDATGLVYDKLATWAATLVQANVAHVVCLTSDTSYPKALVKALPDRVFRQIALGDLAPKVAMNYVLSHLAEKDDETDEERQEQKLEQQEREREQQQQQEQIQQQTNATATGAGAAASAAAKAAAQTKQADTKQASLVEKIEAKFSGKKEGDPADTTAKDAAQSPNKAKAAAKPPRQGRPSASASASASPSTSLPRKETVQELEDCIGVLGGRLTDLESLVRRLKSGQTPKHAVSEIVEQSAAEIIKMFLLAPSKSASSGGSGSGGGGSGGGNGKGGGSGGGGVSSTSGAEQACSAGSACGGQGRVRAGAVGPAAAAAGADGRADNVPVEQAPSGASQDHGIRGGDGAAADSHGKGMRRLHQ
ncbi:mitochondrial escape protein [Niveomyces insectorum RCEF 264]|uniref:Mitochondrial escape protein 2 n=1 Tax=Niveomyces insectorum RCEF 264 TaxID=1081102 RepID=A0A162JD14_9HYPO|nr:mitochondrial escape protein [Niveomyces insectorum RCEF 264]